MASDSREPHGSIAQAHRLRLERSVHAPLESVFESWRAVETFPQLAHATRRVRHIHDTNTLWEVDLAGRQLVWEARVVESVPNERLRWESLRGPRHRGTLSLASEAPDCTRVTIEIEYWPRDWFERLGTMLGLVDRQIARDVDRILRHAEEHPRLPRIEVASVTPIPPTRTDDQHS